MVTLGRIVPGSGDSLPRLRGFVSTILSQDPGLEGGTERRQCKSPDFIRLNFINQVIAIVTTQLMSS
jgi:hypothetical protein